MPVSFDLLDKYFFKKWYLLENNLKNYKFYS